jgi:hypothetical protein
MDSVGEVAPELDDPAAAVAGEARRVSPELADESVRRNILQGDFFFVGAGAMGTGDDSTAAAGIGGTGGTSAASVMTLERGVLGDLGVRLISRASACDAFALLERG